jgi:hypothetical protein
VNPDESEGLEQRCYPANRPDIDERFTRTQPDLGFPTPGPEVIHVIRVEHAVLTPGDVNEDSTWCHTDLVAQPGHRAHRLAENRMVWSSGEWAGVRAI